MIASVGWVGKMVWVGLVGVWLVQGKGTNHQHATTSHTRKGITIANQLIKYLNYVH